jgi:hypothetical protein
VGGVGGVHLVGHQQHFDEIEQILRLVLEKAWAQL